MVISRSGAPSCDMEMGGSEPETEFASTSPGGCFRHWISIIFFFVCRMWFECTTDDCPLSAVTTLFPVIMIRFFFFSSFPRLIKNLKSPSLLQHFCHLS